MKLGTPTAPSFAASLVFIAASLSATPPAFAQTTYRMEGTLRERGTRRPLEGVNVFAIPQPTPAASAEASSTPAAQATPAPALKATTDAQGRFVIESLPAGNFKWVVNFTGYDRLEKYDEQAEGSLAPIPPRDLYLEKSNYFVYETTIYDKAQKRDDKTRSITRDQISKLAGAGNDPVRAVQNLPGVNRASGFSSQVIIEGSSPQDTRYLLDQQQVPLIFHFGGLTTVVPPEVVERVDLLSSGFGTEFGRTTAGLVSVGLKAPARDRLHGLAYADTFSAGAILEGPVGEQSSFLIAARQSYIGAVLKAATGSSEAFNLTVAPEFRDLTLMFQSELTPRDTFRLVAIGSDDSLGFLLKEPVKSNPELRGEFSSNTSFFRLIPEYTHRHNEETISRLSMGFGKDWIRFDTQENYFHLASWALTARGEVEHRFHPYWKTFLGFDNSYTWARVDLELPKTYSAGGVPNPFSVAETRSVNVSPNYSQIGIYWRNEVKLGETPWTLIPAFRVDRYSQTSETIPQPRAQIRYRVNDTFTLRSSGGFYSQAPQPEETDPNYGNPSIKAPRAVHVTLGAEKDLRGGSSRGWNLSGDFFYKHLTSLVTPSFALVTAEDGTLRPENYTNVGNGRIYGIGMQAKYDFKPFSGWITYTLSKSTRWTPTSPEAVTGFDQTHNLAAVGSVELGSNWQLSARFRYVTGNPYTPIAGGTFDADNDIYIPTRGPYFSERVSPFWQLDARIDKKWIFDTWILSAYLDVQNVTNHANIETIRYSYDYSQTSNLEGLPIIPVLGLRGEF